MALSRRSLLQLAAMWPALGLYPQSQASNLPWAGFRLQSTPDQPNAAQTDGKLSPVSLPSVIIDVIGVGPLGAEAASCFYASDHLAGESLERLERAEQSNNLASDMVIAIPDSLSTETQSVIAGILERASLNSIPAVIAPVGQNRHQWRRMLESIDYKSGITATYLDLKGADSFPAQCRHLNRAISAITRPCLCPSLVAVDYADIRTALYRNAKVGLGSGLATGPHRATVAAIAALENFIAKNPFPNPEGRLIVTTTAGRNVSLAEFFAVAEVIETYADPDSSFVVVSIIIDQSMRQALSVDLLGSLKGYAT